MKVVFIVVLVAVMVVPVGTLERSVSGEVRADSSRMKSTSLGTPPVHADGTTRTTVKYGVNTDGTSDDILQLDPTLPHANGIGWLRLIINFANKTNPRLTHFTGQNYSWILDLNQPQDMGSNWTLQDWDHFVDMMVSSHAFVHSWEILNEPTFHLNEGGYLQQAGAQGYFNMLRDAYEIIKAHNSTDTVVALGGLPTYDSSLLKKYDQGNFTGGSSYKWAVKVWSYGAGLYCDAISLHSYSDSRWLLSDFPQNANTTSTLTLQQIWDGTIRAYEGLTGKPVWITETGTPVSGDGGRRQALFLNQSFAYLSGLTFVGAVFWWNMIGLTQSADFGLYTRSETARLSLEAFDRFAVTPGSPPLTSGFLGLPGIEGYVLVGGAVAAVAVAMAVMLIRKRKVAK